LFLLSLSPAKSMKNNVIFIDPGHGGFDGGASYDDKYEKDINLNIAKYLKNYYENLGYEVLLTRYADYSLNKNNENKKREDIQKRVKLINESDCIFYLSIHVNASTMTSLYGAQVFYNNQNKKSEELSLCIQNSFSSMLNTYRKAQKINDIYLIDNVKKTGVLVEVGFLSNSKERELLCDNMYQEKLAYSIYMGTLEYISKK